MSHESILALDLEGTLISNAVSQFPRPGLFGFLEFCNERFEQLFLYTAVNDTRCHAIVYNLVRQQLAPTWLSDIAFIQWDRNLKDLNNIPSATPGECIIIDDNRDYIVEEQISQWIEIKKFEAPYPDSDRELQRVQELIELRFK